MAISCLERCGLKHVCKVWQGFVAKNPGWSTPADTYTQSISAAERTDRPTPNIVFLFYTATHII